MHVWYKAVCDDHKEYCDVFVNNPVATGHLLEPHDQTIYTWLELHRGCSLRLIHDLEEGREGRDFDFVIATYTDTLNPSRFKHKNECAAAVPPYNIQQCVCPGRRH